MEHFFTHKCHDCGGVDEAKFVISGPHIKQVCLHCGKYVKFFDRASLPSIQDIRLKIWAASQQNAELIETAKKSIDYHEYSDSVNYSTTWSKSVLVRLQWWKVYLKVRSIAPSTDDI